nr:hypothetical protein [Tanacetum cinerariifolium]
MRCVGNKMHKAFPLPVIEFPLAEEVPTASEESCHCQKKREATAKRIALLVIEFGDSYEVPASAATTETASGETEIEQDDLNQKFLISLAPEWLMHTIVWRNRSDLDTMSLDDLYNHLKVYESEVQKKSKPNSQNMAFISSAKHSRGNEDVNTASVSTASTNIPTASANNRVASISQDTACAYIAFQSSGSQIKFEDINQIDGDDIEEIDIKWSMALLSMRADKFWKKTGKKISIQGSDVVGFDKSKSYMANDKEDHALVADEEAPIEFALMANTSSGSKVFNNSLCSKDCKKNNDSLNSKITDLTDKLFDAKNMIYHYKLGLAQVESRLVEYKEREIKYYEKIRGLELDVKFNTNKFECIAKELETLKKEKEGVDGNLAGFLTASKDLDNFIESQRSDKNKEGLGYSVVPPPPAQIYSSPKKDFSWTGLPEFADDTVTDYSRPSPTMESTSVEKGKNGTSRSQNNTHESFTPRPVVHKPYRPPVKPMRTNMNGARPNRTTFNKQVHSYANRPFQRTSAVRSQFRAPWVPTANRNFPPVSRKFSTVNRNLSTVNRKFPTANRKFPTGGTKFSNADMGKKGKAGSSQNNIDDKGYWDSGCSRHMTGNISYLSDYEPFDGGYVSFGQGGCKITGKGTIKIGKLEFENVYFVKDLKFTWTFFLKTKDEISDILRKFITEIENLNDLKVKIIRCDNGGEFRNKEMNDFCSQKEIKREFSNARTPQQNGVAERRNRTLIETARTITPAIGFLKPFGCHVMILNTLDNLGKFEEKGDEGCFIVDAGTNSTNLSGTKDAASQEVKKDISSLRYIALLNWVHDALLECSSKTPLLDNILTLANRFEDILGATTNSDESNGVEVDVTNMEITITASPTSTLKIHKDHPKSQIIGPVDSPIQTRNKSKEMGEQSFIATIHQKTDPALLQFCLFSCFLSQVEPKKISDALQHPSWVEAMQEELLQFKI